VARAVPNAEANSLRSVLKEFRTAFVAVAALSGVLNIITLAGSFFMLLVYDRVLPSHSQETLVGLVILVGAVYLFQALLDGARSRILIAIGSAFDAALAGQVFDAISRSRLTQRVGGDGLQPLRDLDLVRAFVAGPGPMSLFDLPWIFLYLGICFAFHWLIGVAALVGAAVLISLTVVQELVSRAPTLELTRLSGQRFGFAGATASGAEVVAAMGMGSRLRQRWLELNQDYGKGQARSAQLVGGLGSFTRVFRMFLQSAVLAVGAYLVINQKSTGGIIIASSILTSRALAPIELAIANWKGFLAARQAWTRLAEVMKSSRPREVATDLPAPTATLTVQALAAAPPGANRLTIQDVSFQLKAGDGLGVVGPSGGGKSSLVRSIVGVWPAVRGAVRLDGAALDQWAPEALGRYIGYLPQSIELIGGTIAENISRFEPDAPSDLVVAAAQAADVHQLILNMPQGYDTPVGTGGADLSAGQRQRVGLARALYRDPFLLVLDEPNSNLDAEGDAALAKAIAGARSRGAIIIVVAHRPNTIEPLDQVMVVSNGRMQALGPKSEVFKHISGESRPSAPAVTPGGLQLVAPRRQN